MKRMYSQEELSALGGVKLYKHKLSIYSSIMTATFTGYIISTSDEKYTGTSLSNSIPIVSCYLSSGSMLITRITEGTNSYTIYASTQGQYLGSPTSVPITTIDDVVSEL